MLMYIWFPASQGLRNDLVAALGQGELLLAGCRQSGNFQSEFPSHELANKVSSSNVRMTCAKSEALSCGLEMVLLHLWSCSVSV